MFSSINQFYALYKENLELAINVSDPEGMPVAVTLMDGSPVQAVIRGDNVLVWNATSSPGLNLCLKPQMHARQFLHITSQSPWLYASARITVAAFHTQTAQEDLVYINAIALLDLLEINAN